MAREIDVSSNVNKIVLQCRHRKSLCLTGSCVATASRSTFLYAVIVFTLTVRQQRCVHNSNAWMRAWMRGCWMRGREMMEGGYNYSSVSGVSLCARAYILENR